MDDDRDFIKDIKNILQSSIDVDDWITVKDLIHEISDYLGEIGEEDDDDDDDYLDN